MLFGHEADFTGEDSGRVKIMKVLIVPMAAMAETAGPSLRCHLLAEGFIDAGFEVATCMAEDMKPFKDVVDDIVLQPTAHSDENKIEEYLSCLLKKAGGCTKRN